MTAHEAAIDHLARANCTMHIRDQAAATVLIRGAGRPAIEALKRYRRGHLDWLTVTQRKWQTHDRTVHENRNLRQRTERQNFGVYAEKGIARETALKCIVEGIETRERYVRCSA